MSREDKIPILQNEQTQKKPIKLILCGDYGSGKTSMIERHINQTFQEGKESPKRMTKIKFNIKIKQNVETLLIWDTNGEEKYQSLQMNHFRNADCAIIVFDVSNENSFESLEYWFNIVKMYEPEIPILFVGNKSDKRIEVSYDRALVVAQQCGCELIYCSAKTGKNVNKVFRRIVRIYFNIKEGDDDVKIEEEQDENLPVKNHCCNCC